MKTDKWNAAQYEKFKQERAQPFLDLMGLIEPEQFERCIDLGCGTGELTKLFHDTFKIQETLGIDTSSSMLKRAESFKSDGLTFRIGDLTQFKERNAYDMVISNAAVHWAPHHHEILENIFVSLKSQGQLAIQMPANHDYPTHTIANAISPLARPEETSMRTLPEYAHMLHKLGFQEQKVIMKVYGHVMESRHDVLEWVKGSLLTAYEAKLGDKFPAFLSEYKTKLFEVLPDERPFFYPFKRIFIWARKP